MRARASDPLIDCLRGYRAARYAVMICTLELASVAGVYHTSNSESMFGTTLLTPDSHNLSLAVSCPKLPTPHKAP
ncbi:hypothetical protein M404DRAFT_996749 [Pisolithus tinctorius Marx 270]|uniref:Uncharacterized protein n=1 Tax=Pisolithus tinctorius Marx 270 TaxID=870435 RepID=A0A0C3P6R8_PISTI|nr:hypothetical protein M404DRAFT_996749 [Pisolithus tinctorius Marx 270]